MNHRSCIPLAAACCLSGFSFTAPTLAEEVLVERGAKSTWSYLDTGTAPDKAWTTAAFEAKDISAPLKTKLRAYELPDWQFIKAEVQLKPAAE